MAAVALTAGRGNLRVARGGNRRSTSAATQLPVCRYSPARRGLGDQGASPSCSALSLNTSFGRPLPSPARPSGSWWGARPSWGSSHTRRRNCSGPSKPAFSLRALRPTPIWSRDQSGKDHPFTRLSVTTRMALVTARLFCPQAGETGWSPCGTKTQEAAPGCVWKCTTWPYPNSPPVEKKTSPSLLLCCVTVWQSTRSSRNGSPSRLYLKNTATSA